MSNSPKNLNIPSLLRKKSRTQFEGSPKINNSKLNFAPYSLDFSEAEEEESLMDPTEESEEDLDSLTGQDLVQRHHLIFRPRVSPILPTLSSQQDDHDEIEQDYTSYLLPSFRPNRATS